MTVNELTQEIRQRVIEKYGESYKKYEVDAEIEDRKEQFLGNFDEGDFRDDLEKLLDNHEVVIELDSNRGYDGWDSIYAINRHYKWYHQEALARSNRELNARQVPYYMVKDLVPDGVSVREFATLEIVDNGFLEVGPWKVYNGNEHRLDADGFVIHYDDERREFNIFQSIYDYATGDITKSSNTIKGWVATIALMEYLKYLYDSGFAVRKPEKYDTIRLKISSGLIVKQYQTLIIVQIMKSLGRDFKLNNPNKEYITTFLSRIGAVVDANIKVQKTNDCLCVTSVNAEDLLEFDLYVDKLDNREVIKVVPKE